MTSNACGLCELLGRRRFRPVTFPKYMPPSESGAYFFDDEPARVNVAAVWDFLAAQAYWARWRTRDVFEQQLRSAWRVVGAYEQATGDQVGFCRAVSDGCAVAYLADVFVLPAHRGRGLGAGLVREMIEPDPAPDSCGCCTRAMHTRCMPGSGSRRVTTIATRSDRHASIRPWRSLVCGVHPWRSGVGVASSLPWVLDHPFWVASGETDCCDLAWLDCSTMPPADARHRTTPLQPQTRVRRRPAARVAPPPGTPLPRSARCSVRTIRSRSCRTRCQ